MDTMVLGLHRLVAPPPLVTLQPWSRRPLPPFVNLASPLIMSPPGQPPNPLVPAKYWAMHTGVHQGDDQVAIIRGTSVEGLQAMASFPRAPPPPKAKPPHGHARGSCTEQCVLAQVCVLAAHPIPTLATEKDENRLHILTQNSW